MATLLKLTNARSLGARLLLALGVCATLAAALPTAAQAGDGLVVIAHMAVPRLDAATLARLYTGRAVEVAGAPANVVNAAPGSGLRLRFLQQVLQLDDEQYRAYWMVRRHVGKGIPPRDLANSADVIQFVQATPGAIGYIESSELRPGLNVVYKP